MESTMPTSERQAQTGFAAALRQNAPLIGAFIGLLVLPFVIAILNGQSASAVLGNETGTARFIQGLLIEVFILGVYALSYDLILGITGLLSFGHAMFFAVGAYTTGIMLKTFEWGLLPTIGAVIVAGILNALLFALVLPRVKGITFALVTLGLASVFHIVVQSSELSEWTGADVGLQGVIKPAILDTSTERFRFYVVALIFMFVAYLIYRRFVDSPTGRVCVATRENENRALMLGYNTFYFKLIALVVASITAGLAGFLHALHQPIISPNIAGLGWTVAALLMILIGGVGTLSGALIGAAVFRLLEFYLDRWFEAYAPFILGLIYILLVLFVPYGIVGTWRARGFNIREGRQRLRAYLMPGERPEVGESIDEEPEPEP
jgi:branched-chain amino acid transport system permease protein